MQSVSLKSINNVSVHHRMSKGMPWLSRDNDVCYSSLKLHTLEIGKGPISQILIESKVRSSRWRFCAMSLCGWSYPRHCSDGQETPVTLNPPWLVVVTSNEAAYIVTMRFEIRLAQAKARVGGHALVPTYRVRKTPPRTANASER